MTAHGLRGVIITADEGRPLIVCDCGEVASFAAEARWEAEAHEDGTRTYHRAENRSFNWEGHFHVMPDRLKVLDKSERRRAP